jgi:hypothetical protein
MDGFLRRFMGSTLEGCISATPYLLKSHQTFGHRTRILLATIAVVLLLSQEPSRERPGLGFSQMAEAQR